MKTAIQQALGDEKLHPADLTARGNQDLLLFLALKGSLIYTNFMKEAVAPEGPLQIITNYPEYLPIEFVYAFPPPDDKATLCSQALEALRTGYCCGNEGAKKNPAEHVCPFGFWSFSRVIERHSYRRENTNSADYCIVSEPDNQRSTLHVLQTALFGSSKKVDNSGVDIRKEIALSLRKYAEKVTEADSWKSWTEQVTKQNPDSLILVVHIEKDKGFKMDKLEIGDQDFVLQIHIGSKVILKEHLLPPPFVIVLGCESTNLQTEGFDVSSHFINVGAAIVLSNFTKIKGSHAKEILISLFELIDNQCRKRNLVW